MNQGVLFQVVEKRDYVKNGDSFKDCAVYDVYPEFPRNYHYERRGALKIQGLA